MSWRMKEDVCGRSALCEGGALIHDERIRGTGPDPYGTDGRDGRSRQEKHLEEPNMSVSPTKRS